MASEAVARLVAKKEIRHSINSGASVGEHLADQLLWPFTPAGSGEFVTSTRSSHREANIGVIEKFLPVMIRESEEGNAFRVELSSATE